MISIQNIIDKVAPLKKEGKTLEEIIEILYNMKVSAPFSSIVISKVFEIQLSEANDLIFESKFYRKFGEINDAFLDAVTSPLE